MANNELNLNLSNLLKNNPDLHVAQTFITKECTEATPEISLKDRYLSASAVLLGCGGQNAYRIISNVALKAGICPVALQETCYQAIDYLGLGRVLPFITILNEEMLSNGISLPLESQATTTEDDRLEKGNAKQVELFGPGLKESWLSAPDDRKVINKFLAANCFGDYYTRTGLDNRERELITFCFNYAQGGADPQTTAHALANINSGNSPEYLVQIVNANVGWIGYPRSLNAISCIEAAAAKLNK
jgi:4-carboxymuconolactone decarboxylase